VIGIGLGLDLSNVGIAFALAQRPTANKKSASGLAGSQRGM
jgi:hypothetical protein